MNRKFAGAMICGAALTTAVAAASYYLTDKMMDVALKREMPWWMAKNIDRIAGSKVDKEARNTQKAAMEVLQNAGCQKVTITARDGTPLVGHWHFDPNAKRTVIAMHGWRSSWVADFGIISAFWFRQGCNVLFAEQRGQGESGGDYMTFGAAERLDCCDWAKWVSNRSTLPIYLAGLSMGAATVLMAADTDLPQAVHGIMADCGFTSPEEIFRHVAKDNLRVGYNILRKKHVEQAFERRCMKKGVSALDALKASKVPVLLIHGEDDKFVPVSMAYKLYDACTAPKVLLTVPGADHAMSYLVNPDAYRQTVSDFWKQYD